MSESSVVLFRVDPRLVHATLVNAWVPATKAQQILVADAVVAGDARRRTIVEIAAIEVGPVLFASEEEAAERLAESNLPTIVLFSTLEGVEKAVRGGLKVADLNVGHVPAGPDRTEYLPSVFLGPNDLSTLHALQSMGITVHLQALPEDEPLLVEAPASPDGDTHAEAVLEIVNERGLHLRAAHVLAALCNRLPNGVEIGREGYMVNAKSLLGLTALGAAAGTRLTVVVTGEGAAAGLEAVRKLFESGFDEGVAPGRRGSG